MSRFYDILAGSSEKRLIRKGVEKLEIQPGEKVLDIGCGTGTGILLIADLTGVNGKTCGIDLSEGMLDKARDKLLKANLIDRVELRRGDALHLPWPDSAFDAVFMSFTLELFNPGDMFAALAESRRVLTKKGRICVVGMSEKTGSGPMMKLYRAAHKHFPDFVDCRPIQVDRVVRRAGFKIRQSELLTMWGLGIEIVLGER